MISRVDMEDGGKVEYTYDSLDRLTGEKRSDPYGQVLAWDLYEYDLAGNRTRKTMLDAASNTLMTVNSALSTGNRLASWAVPETNLMARFPVAGHASEPIGTNDRFGALWISNATPGGMSVKPGVEGTNFWVHDFTVGMGTQQIVAAIRDMAGNMAYVTNTVIPSVLTNGTYQYSAAGCLTNIAYAGKDVSQTLGLSWDGQYQLTAVSTGAVVESYQYDAFGRRVMTASGGVTNWHVYDGVQVIADLDSTGGVTRTYVWGPGTDNLLAMTAYGTTTNTLYALRDHLGSILAMTDASGQIVEQYRYDAWGRTTVFDASGNPLTTSAIGNRYCWQGREYSWNTGLYNFRARWYDPITGRWLSNDPIGISGGLNQYQAFLSNPVNYRDPDGLDVVYLVDDSVVAYQGHAAALVGSDTSGWTYYSFGVGQSARTSMDNYDVRHYRNLQDAIRDIPRYTLSIRYQTSECQDKKARQQGNSFFGDKYNIFTKNCSDKAAEIMRAAGVDFKNAWRPVEVYRRNRPYGDSTLHPGATR